MPTINRRFKKRMRNNSRLNFKIWENIIESSAILTKEFEKSFRMQISKHTKRKLAKGFLTPAQARRKDGDVIHIGGKLS